MVYRGCPPYTLCGISSRFQLLSPSERQVAHTLLTRPPLSQIPLRRISKRSASFDLHVLGTPPAFILSQDQTLNKSYPNSLSAAQILLKLSSSQRNFQSLFRLKEPFSGAYLHKLFLLTLFNFQGTLCAVHRSGSFYTIPQAFRFVKNFFQNLAIFSKPRSGSARPLFWALV